MGELDADDRVAATSFAQIPEDNGFSAHFPDNIRPFITHSNAI